MKKRMTKTTAFLLALFLMAGLMAESAMAANEQIKIPATIIKGFYQENSDGFERILADEESRCFATILAYLDWFSYDQTANFLLEYAYIGKDKEGEVLWIGLGGQNSSIVLAYSPESNPDYYSGVEVQLGGIWIPTFIDIYCDPLYNNSAIEMKSMAEKLYGMVE